MVTRAHPPRYRGRDGEQQVLDRTLDDAASGRLTGVIVEGEPGIGKSRFLSEGLAAAGTRRFQIAAGRAEELERTRPFGVLVDALDCSTSSSDPRRAAIGALLSTRMTDDGPITVTSDPGLQFQVVDAIVDLVEAEALRRPLVLALDDLQWADPSSLLSLDALARRLTYVPLACIVCMRPAPRSEELERVADTLAAVGGRRLALGELGDEAVTELVAEVAGAEPGPNLAAAVAGAGGNPLFVSELVSALVDEGAVDTVDGCAEVAEVSLPPSLRLTILRRLAFLPAGTIHVLRSASILGTSFTLAELSTVMAGSAFAVSSTLDEAFAGGVLIDDGDRVRFRHDLIRDAVYADLPASLRRGLHSEAGQRLAAAGASAVRVAEHVARAADQGDAEAIAWLTRAAREAATTSPGVAADLLQRAIELTGASDTARDPLLVERAGILMWAGRIQEAEAICRALLERPHDPAVETSARMCLGRCLVATGHMEPALRELELVYGSPSATAAQQAESRGWASVAVSLDDLDAAVAAAETTRSAATDPGAHVAVSLATSMLAWVGMFRAQLCDALATVDDGVAQADVSPARQGHRYPLHVIRGRILIELDRLEDARATLETGMRISEELGVRWPLSAYQTILAIERFVAGEWDDALAEFEAAVELADETGERYNLVLGYRTMSLIAVHRNDLERASELASAADDELDHGGGRYPGHWSARTRALLLEAAGDAPAAYAALGECWDQSVSAGLAVEYPALGPDLVRLALAVGDHARARQVTSAVDAVAARNEVASLDGAALRCRGLCDDDADVLQHAVEVFGGSPRRLQLALTREEAGAALVRSGDRDRAVPVLDQALDGFEQLEAERDVARVRATLRELGVQRGQRGTRQRPRTGWASLTPTERTVSDLVAEGLTNPQIGERLFVSRRTVQTHLAHVFRKLQMSSRTELAAAITRRQDGGDPGGR